MSKIFRLLRRGSRIPAERSDAADRPGSEAGQAAENEERRRVSEREAHSRAAVNEARRQAADAETRRQAGENEARRLVSDSEGRRQADANEARDRADDGRSPT
jgi:hypothetical protein